MKRTILAAFLATLGWLGTTGDAVAQTYTFDPYSRMWYQTQTAYYTSGVIPASSVVYSYPSTSVAYYPGSNWVYPTAYSYPVYTTYSYYNPYPYNTWRIGRWR